MTDSTQPETADPGLDTSLLAGVEGMTALVDAACGLAKMCVDRGFSAATGEYVARTFMVEAIRKLYAPAPPSLADLFKRRG